MNYRSYSTEGFVIGRKKFGDADRIITLFTKTHGKVTLIAKGVRKITSKKRGGIEVFSLIKFSAIKSATSFDILTEVEIIKIPDIKNNLKKVTLSYYFCEVMSRVTSEEEKSDESYDLFKSYFEKLETSKSLKKLRLDFVRDILVSRGFWPHNKPMNNPDAILESVTERQINSFRIGRKMLQQN